MILLKKIKLEKITSEHRTSFPS